MTETAVEKVAESNSKGNGKGKGKTKPKVETIEAVEQLELPTN